MSDISQAEDLLGLITAMPAKMRRKLAVKAMLTLSPETLNQTFGAAMALIASGGKPLGLEEREGVLTFFDKINGADYATLHEWKSPDETVLDIGFRLTLTKQCVDDIKALDSEVV